MWAQFFLWIMNMLMNNSVGQHIAVEEHPAGDFNTYRWFYNNLFLFSLSPKFLVGFTARNQIKTLSYRCITATSTQVLPGTVAMWFSRLGLVQPHAFNRTPVMKEGKKDIKKILRRALFPSSRVGRIVTILFPMHQSEDNGFVHCHELGCGLCRYTGQRLWTHT